MVLLPWHDPTALSAVPGYRVSVLCGKVERILENRLPTRKRLASSYFLFLCVPDQHLLLVMSTLATDTAQPAFLTWHNDTLIPGSKRARAACTACRQRKIRCDARNGQPCSSCVFDNVQCILLSSQRRRKKVKASEKRSVSSPAPDMHNPVISPPVVANQNQDQYHQPGEPAPPSQAGVIDSSDVQVPPLLSRTEADEPSSASVPSAEHPDEIDWQAAAAKCVPNPVSPNPSAGASNENNLRMPDSSATPLIPSFLK